MTTINSVGTGLSGASGSGSFVGSTSPTLVTPTLGAATATSVAFSPTTGGIIGTTAADNATAGDVGELFSGTNATAVAMSTGSVTLINSISLTAGDWDVWGAFYTVVGGTTVNSNIQAQLHTTTATIAAPSTAQLASIQGSFGTITTGQQTFLNLGVSRWNLSAANTTVYLNAVATYSVSTLTGNGNIFARRRR